MITEKIHELHHGKAIARQGDVLLQPVDEIPENAEAVKSEKGSHVIAHSETGHNHVLASHKVNMFMMRDDPLVAYIEVSESTLLDHQRSFDTHETIRVHPGKYRIRRQREHSPDGWRRARD